MNKYFNNGGQMRYNYISQIIISIFIINIIYADCGSCEVDILSTNKPIHNSEIAKIGADLPICFNSRDCIASGIGDQIVYKNNFPKYYFVLVKPKFALLTNRVYSNLNKSAYNKGHKDFSYNLIKKFNL